MVKSLKFLIGKQGVLNFYKLLFILIIASSFEFFALGLMFPLIAVMLGVTTTNFGLFNDITKLILSLLPNFYYGLILFLIFFIIKGIFFTFSSIYQSNIIFSIHHDLSMRLLKKYTLSSYQKYVDSSAATYTRNILIEVNQFVRAYVIPLTSIISDSIILFFVLIFLIVINPLAAFAIFFLGGFFSFLYIFLLRSRIRNIGFDRQFFEKSRINHLNENFSAFKEIIIYGKSDFFLKRFSADNRSYCHAGMEQSILASIPRIWYEPITVVLIVLLSFILILFETQSNDILIIVGMFSAAGLKLLPGISRILSNVNVVKYSSPVVNLLTDELRSDDSAIDFSAPSSILDNTFMRLDFLNVSFSFSGESSPLFSNLSFNVCKGDCVGITGDSGAGKSTLLNLLLGFQVPSSGVITIEGSTNKISAQDWIHRIAYVGQKVPIFDESIAFNITLSNDDQIDFSKLESAISAAKIQSLIESRGAVFSRLGSGGVKLSGGEIQRIGIARALYFGREILIMDEPTSSLDMENEKSLVDDISALKGFKTIFLVTHRSYPLSICNKSIQL